MMSRIARRQLVANMLRQAGAVGVTNAELIQGGAGARYSARIFELREEGWRIDAKRLRDGVWRYKLVSEPVRRVEPVEPGEPVDAPEPSRLFDDVDRAPEWPYDPDRDEVSE